MARGRRGRDLALVSPPITMGRGFDSQQPVFRVELVIGLETKVRGVGEAADGQEMGVVMPQPGNLKENDRLFNK